MSENLAHPGPGPEKSEESNARIAQKLSALKILIVEDVEINAFVLSRYLEKLKITSKWAIHGRTALEMFSQEDYDMIFLDLQMPVMNGYDTAVAIRQLPDPKKRNVPIIVMSSLVFDEDIERAYASGVNDYLNKPLDIEILKDKITQHCGPQTS